MPPKLNLWWRWRFRYAPWANYPFRRPKYVWVVWSNDGSHDVGWDRQGAPLRSYDSLRDALHAVYILSRMGVDHDGWRITKTVKYHR